MLMIYYHMLISTWKTFGFGKSFLFWFLVIPPLFLFTQLTLFLDRIFFPQYRQVEVKSPVFILGGRSGSTFLHRLLTQTGEFPVFQAWEIFFPALTARLLIKPIVNYLVKQDRAQIYPKEVGHELYLDTVEEEEVLFMHKLDTQFVTLTTPLAFDDIEHPELRFHDHQPRSRRLDSVKFFKGCLQRQILYTGNHQVIGKINYSVNRIKTLLEVFPDAKFIFLWRSPQHVIPSHLSLHRKMLDHQWGLNNIPPDKLKRYLERRYRYNVEIYRYFDELKQNQTISPNNLMFIPYDLLCSDLEGAFAKIVAFTGIQPSEQLRQSISQQAQKQKNYQRSHKIVSLEELGLTEEQIAKDLSFVSKEFMFN